MEGREFPSQVVVEAGGGTGPRDSTAPTAPGGDQIYERPHLAEVANFLAQPLDLSDPAIRAEIALEVRALEDAEVAATIVKAKKLGIPLFIADDDGPGVSLSHFEGDRPVYVGSNNLAAAISTNASRVRSTAPFNVDGTGHVIGLWEAHSFDRSGNVYGHPRTTHQEFWSSFKDPDSRYLYSRQFPRNACRGNACRIGNQSFGSRYGPRSNR